MRNKCNVSNVKYDCVHEQWMSVAHNWQIYGCNAEMTDKHNAWIIEEFEGVVADECKAWMKHESMQKKMK